MLFSDAVEAFFEVSKNLAGMSDGTEQAYRSDFTGFERHLEAQGVRDVASITTAHVNGWLLEQRKRGLSLTTIHRRKNALSSLLSFCLAQGWLASNPVEAVKLQTKPRRTRNIVLDEDEVRGFLAAAVSYRSVSATTAKAVRVLATFTGLRSGELRALDWEHVDRDRRVLGVYNSKNTHLKGLEDGKDRDIPLSSSVIAALGELDGSREGPVLTNRRGGRISKDGIEGIVKRAAESAGIKRHGRPLTPHCLRHNLSSQLNAAGFTVPDIAALLGHTPGNVTQGYIHVVVERLRKGIQDYDDAIHGALRGAHSDNKASEGVAAGGLVQARLGTVFFQEAQDWWETLQGEGAATEDFLLGFVAGCRARSKGKRSDG